MILIDFHVIVKHLINFVLDLSCVSSSMIAVWFCQDDVLSLCRLHGSVFRVSTDPNPGGSFSAFGE